MRIKRKVLFFNKKDFENWDRKASSGMRWYGTLLTLCLFHIDNRVDAPRLQLDPGGQCIHGYSVGQSSSQACLIGVGVCVGEGRGGA